jgi:hypothetical protein
MTLPNRFHKTLVKKVHLHVFYGIRCTLDSSPGPDKYNPHPFIIVIHEPF